MTWPWMIAFASLTVALLALTVVVTGHLREVSGLLERAEFQLSLASSALGGLGGLGQGERVRPFRVQGMDGEIVGSESLLSSPSVILFTEDSCEPCEELAPELEGLEFPDSVRLIVLHQGDVVPRVPSGSLLFRQIDRSASRAFHNVAAPQAFAIEPGGVVADRLIPISAQQIQGLASMLRKEVNTDTAQARAPQGS